MIGRQFKFKFKYGERREVNLTILDKITAIERSNITIASGKGGTISGISHPFPITFYLCEDNEGKLYTINPDKIYKLEPLKE